MNFILAIVNIGTCLWSCAQIVSNICTNKTTRILSQSKFAQAVIFLTCIWKELGSNLGWGNDYPDWRPSSFSSVLPGKVRIIPPSGHDSLLPIPSNVLNRLQTAYISLFIYLFKGECIVCSGITTDCLKRPRNWKSGQGPTKGCRAIDRQMHR
jgi:hypothetical protein